MHGIVGFLNPILIISIVLLYFSFVSMLVDLSIRFNLYDYHIILFGFCFGMIQETFGNGSTFRDANVCGINVINIVLINIIWWGLIQGVLALYFANRIVKFNVRDANKMGKVGWGLAIGFIIVMLLVSVVEGTLPSASFTAYAISIGLILASFVTFLLLKKDKTVKSVKNIKAFDVLIMFQFILSIFIGIIHSVIGTTVAIHLFISWSLFVVLVYIMVRFKGKVGINSVDHWRMI